MKQPLHQVAMWLIFDGSKVKKADPQHSSPKQEKVYSVNLKPIKMPIMTPTPLKISDEKEIVKLL